MKGQSGGRTSGSSRRNVSVPRLGIGTNIVVLLESESPEDGVWGREGSLQEGGCVLKSTAQHGCLLSLSI